MNIGISTASLYPLETELALEEIGKAGIKNTEIFFNCETELKPSFIDILSEIKQKYSLNISACHPTMSLADSFMIFSNYERRFYESLDIYRRYSEIAAELGAKYIIMHGGKPNGLLSDEEYCERYMALKDVTKQNGVTVLQENVFRFRAGDIEFLRSMVDILGEEAELCFDIKQSIRCGYLPMEIFKEFSKNIKHCHISDHSVATDCTLPFKGGFDFAGFFHLLQEESYKGDCMIEVYSNSYKAYSEIYESFEKIKKFNF